MLRSRIDRQSSNLSKSFWLHSNGRVWVHHHYTTVCSASLHTELNDRDGHSGKKTPNSMANYMCQASLEMTVWTLHSRQQYELKAAVFNPCLHFPMLALICSRSTCTYFRQFICLSMVLLVILGDPNNCCQTGNLLFNRAIRSYPQRILSNVNRKSCPPHLQCLTLDL